MASNHTNDSQVCIGRTTAICIQWMIGSYRSYLHPNVFLHTYKIFIAFFIFYSVFLFQHRLESNIIPKQFVSFGSPRANSYIFRMVKYDFRYLYKTCSNLTGLAPMLFFSILTCTFASVDFIRSLVIGRCVNFFSV